jgi:hypothetical protein
MAIGGCQWALDSAAPPPTPPPSSSALTIQAAQLSSSGTETDVLLTLFNAGTLPESSIDLTSISLRTLAGTGQATILSPAQPTLTSGLAAGDSTNVLLKLNIPAGITKLEIVEQGSIDLGQQEATRFSEGQVLYAAH